MKRVALLAAAALAAVAMAAALWQFRAVALLFVLSLAVTAALRPLADRQARHRWPRPLALLMVYGLTLGLAGLLAWLAAGPILDDARAALDDLSLAYERLWQTWPHGSSFQQAFVALLPAPAELYESLGGPAGAAALQRLLGVTQDLLGLLAGAALVLVLSLYWGLDQARAERLWLSVLPAESRARAREIWRAIEDGVGAYLRSEVTQSVLAGALLGLGYWALGVHYPALLAALSAVLWLVPWLGAVLALGPLLLAAWAQGPWLALWAGIYTLVVFVVLEFGVEPRLYNRRRHSALLVVMLLIVLGQAFGLAGVLAAPPLAAALQILAGHWLAPAAEAPNQSVGAEYAALQARVRKLRLMLEDGGQPRAANAQNLAGRLEALMDESAGVLGEAHQRRSSSAVSSAPHGQ